MKLLKVVLCAILLSLANTDFLAAEDLFGYVGTGGTTVRAINVTTETVAPISINVLFPFGIAITPDRQFAYVTHTPSSVSAIDLTTNTVASTILLGAQGFGVSIPPAGTHAYVCVNDGGSINRVVVIDIASNMISDTINLASGSAPAYIAVTPDGQRAYVSNQGDDTVTILDLTNNTIITTLSGFTLPFQLAVTPDGQKVFVTERNSNQVSVIDVATDNVTLVSGYTGVRPVAIGITAEGSKAVISNTQGANSISFVDTAAESQIANVTPVAASSWLAIRPDDLRGYATNGTNNIRIIDVPTNTLAGNIALGASSVTIAITPDQAPTAAFTSVSGLPQEPTQFDASSSTTPSGTIVSYIWDFGDGSPEETTASPLISHTYASVGTYPVSLRVINSNGTSTSVTFTGQTVSNNGGPSAQITQQVTITPFVPPIEILPPRDVRGRQVKNVYLNKTILVNVITWQPPTEGNPPVAYRIYRDASLTQLAAEVPASVLRFTDPNRKKHEIYFYYIVSVDAEGNVSTPAVIDVP